MNALPALVAFFLVLVGVAVAKTYGLDNAVAYLAALILWGTALCVLLEWARFLRRSLSRMGKGAPKSDGEDAKFKAG